MIFILLSLAGAATVIFLLRRKLNAENAVDLGDGASVLQQLRSHDDFGHDSGGGGDSGSAGGGGDGGGSD